MSLAGLAGSHRSGKTTLARRYAEKTGALFVETPVSAVFTEFGADPQETMTFERRMDIQERVMERLETLYRAGALSEKAIADRTPLDMAAYTLANCHNASVPADQQARLAKYIDKCFDVTNKYFTCIVLVQPGIEIVEAPGKAAPSMAYMEELNFLLRGLMSDDRLHIHAYNINRTSMELDRRFDALDFCVKRSMERHAADLEAFKAENRQTN